MRNIYENLNEAIIKINEQDQEGFSALEAGRIKNNFRKSITNKKFKYKQGIVAAVFAMGLCLVLFRPMPLVAAIKAISFDIASFLGIEDNLESYKTVVNQTITHDGITIKLNEVIIDQDELVVSATAVSSEKLGEFPMFLDGKVFIDGKRSSSGAGGSSKQIDNYTVEEVTTYRLEKPVSGDLNIKIGFSVRVNEKTKRGPWNFAFKANGDELAIDTKIIHLHDSFTLQNGQKVTLEKYTDNSLGQKIYYSKSNEEMLYDIVLKGYDDLNHEVEFCLSHESKGKGYLRLSNIHGNLSNRAKLLRLTPYAVKFPERSGKLSNDIEKVGEAFIIDLNDTRQ